MEENTEIVLDEEKIAEFKTKYEEAKEKYTNTLEEYEKKLYLVDGEKDVAVAARKWLITDCEWSYSECVAVYKLVDEIDESLSNIASGRTKKFFLKAAPLTALNYLMSKYKATGYQKAKEFKEIVMPTIETLNGSVKSDQDALKDLEEHIKNIEFCVTAYMEGMEPDQQVLDIVKKYEADNA